MSYNYIETLLSQDLHRYNLKLDVSDLRECPYRLPADTWTDDMTQWPDMSFGDLYVYLTSTPGVFTQQAMKAYKSLEAHRYFTAGFVQRVLSHRTSPTVVVLRADVRPSQRGNDPSHHPWVAIHNNGQVIAGHCTCMAGLGESCSHVAALLFKVEAGVRLGLTSVACTSEQCKWNNFFTEKVEPAPIRDIEFYSKPSVTKVTNTGRMRRNTSDMPSPDRGDKMMFLQSLCTTTHLPVGLSLFRQTSQNFKAKRTHLPRLTLPRTLRSTYVPTYKTLTDSDLAKKCQSVIETTNVSEQQRDYIQQQTKTQNNSIVWHEQRAGRITASFAHTVLHTDQGKPAASVVKGVTIMRTKPIMAAALVYGRENESVVFKLFSEEVSSHHVRGKLEVTGMMVDIDRPWLSATADGIVKCECHGSTVLEIKCPYSARDMSPEDYLQDKSSFIYQGNLDKKHKYYTQVQLQMLVYGMEACDLVVYVGGGLICVEVVRDNEYINNILPLLETFWKIHIVHELVTRTLENAPKRRESDTEHDQNLYCYCQQQWDGEAVLVGCDGISCKYKWIHLGCIRPKRKTVPKGTWYCKDCKVKK